MCTIIFYREYFAVSVLSMWTAVGIILQPYIAALLVICKMPGRVWTFL
jgi:hypothetical protein